MTLSSLDSRDTAALKGLAISAIVFHNFFHFVNLARENEFDFDPARFRILLRTAVHPSLSVQSLSSFFGHFGVQVFIFLSAYGLAKKHWDDQAGWIPFMWGRIKKLYPVFGLVILPFLAMACLQFGTLFFIRRFGLELGLMLAALSNILPGYGLPPIGPWWFIPFIMQFYALWPIIRQLTNRFGWRGLLVLSLLSLLVTYVFNPELDRRWSINLLETPIGHMPEICLGTIAARYTIRLNASWATLACAVVLLGSLYRPLWLLSFVAVLIASLWAYLMMRGLLRGHVLERIGHYSLVIFLVNAIVRNEFLRFANSPYSQLFFAGVTALVSFSVAALIQEFVNRYTSDRHTLTTGQGSAA